MNVLKVDWKKVSTIINDSGLFKKTYTGTYCKMVYVRKVTSGKLLKQIKIILDSSDVRHG